MPALLLLLPYHAVLVWQLSPCPLLLFAAAAAAAACALHPLQAASHC
jgi:hypothetical protein